MTDTPKTAGNSFVMDIVARSYAVAMFHLASTTRDDRQSVCILREIFNQCQSASEATDEQLYEFVSERASGRSIVPYTERIMSW